MEKTPQEMANEINTSIEAIKTQLNDAVSKEDYNALKGQLDAMPKNEAITKLQADISEALEGLNQLKEKGSFSEERKTIKQVLEANKENILNAFKGGIAKDFTVKAIASTTAVTNNSSTFRDNELSPLAVKKLSIYDLFRKVRIGKDNNGSITYWDWDTATTARATAMVAEGGTFPQSTVKWEEFAIKIKKIGDSMAFSEEFEYDTAMFADELEQFLAVNVALVEDTQLLTGAGTGNNIFGLQTLAPAYTAPPSSIQDASHYDLIVKVAEDITKGLGNKFRPNFVLASLTEINKMRLKKDANNNYVLPPFVDRNGNNVAGMIVMEENGLADDTLIVGDSKYGKIYEDESGYTLTPGYGDGQFIKDQKTLKARKRMCFLIKNSEKLGFRKVASVSASIALLASDPA